MGQPVSAQTIHHTLHQIVLHGCCPRRKPLKMMHKKSRKQFAEDKQTKDMDYWNHVLWSDETKINLFVTLSVKSRIKSNYEITKSNQIKSLLLSHHQRTCGLVSEILESVLQTVQKQFTYRQYILSDLYR